MKQVGSSFNCVFENSCSNVLGLICIINLVSTMFSAFTERKCVEVVLIPDMKNSTKFRRKHCLISQSMLEQNWLLSLSINVSKNMLHTIIDHAFVCVRQKYEYQVPHRISFYNPDFISTSMSRKFTFKFFHAMQTLKILACSDARRGNQHSNSCKWDEMLGR